MNGSQDDFSTDELALIPPDDGEGLREEQGTAPGVTPAPAPTAQTTDTPAAPAPPAVAAAAAPEAPATQAENGGDLRAALRAARHAERRAKQRAAQLETENEELRQRAPAASPADDPDAITDQEIEEAAAINPTLAKVARVVAQQVASATTQQGAAPATDKPEFIPPELPPDVQDQVDLVPDLLAWQLSPDQVAFRAAVEADRYLQTLPAWQGKSMQERFTEVVKRVKADGLAPSLEPNRADPMAAIQNAPRAVPNTLSDIGGGGGKQPERSNLDRFLAAKNDDEILADLARLG